jgi:hypothetical protein
VSSATFGKRKQQCKKKKKAHNNLSLWSFSTLFWLKARMPKPRLTEPIPLDLRTARATRSSALLCARSMRSSTSGSTFSPDGQKSSLSFPILHCKYDCRASCCVGSQCTDATAQSARAVILANLFRDINQRVAYAPVYNASASVSC